MSKNKIGEDSPIPKFIYLKIRRRDGVKSLTTLEEGEFKVPTDGCIKVDMPILTCILFSFNWLTLTSEMHFVKFHPEVASCLLSRGKRKSAPWGWGYYENYIRNYFLVYHLISYFLLYLQNYEEFEAEILNLQSVK